MIIPERLKKGDKIGVIAPSSPITEESIETINNSILLMESSGFQIEFGKYVFTNELGYSATDEYDGDLTNKVEIKNYKDNITYKVSDSSASQFHDRGQ